MSVIMFLIGTLIFTFFLVGWIWEMREEEKNKEANRIIWLGKKIPQDRTIVVNQLRELNIWLYFSMVVLSLIGVFFAAFLIYFNFKYSHRR